MVSNIALAERDVAHLYDELYCQRGEAENRIQEAQLRSATPHWLRHTHASHALEGGADLTTVRDNQRHASLTTTSGYLHVDQARRSRQLGRAFGVALKKPRSIRPSV